MCCTATHHSRIDTNVYEGKPITGRVVVTISRGRVVWENGRLNVTRGSGRFVPLATHGPLFEGLERSPPLARWEAAFPYGRLPVRRPGDGADDGAAGSSAADSRGGEL